MHAEVSFNPSGSSRRSLGETSGVAQCGVKGRSSATVSFSDIISTRSAAELIVLIFVNDVMIMHS